MFLAVIDHSGDTRSPNNLLPQMSQIRKPLPSFLASIAVAPPNGQPSLLAFYAYCLSEEMSFF